MRLLPPSSVPDISTIFRGASLHARLHFFSWRNFRSSYTPFIRIDLFPLSSVVWSLSPPTSLILRFVAIMAGIYRLAAFWCSSLNRGLVHGLRDQKPCVCYTYALPILWIRSRRRRQVFQDRLPLPTVDVPHLSLPFFGELVVFRISISE